MALMIEVKAGASFWVDGIECVVDRINSPTSCYVTVKGAAVENRFLISDKQTVAIMPQVKASIGLRSTYEAVRLGIEAPRNISIDRRNPHAVPAD